MCLALFWILFAPAQTIACVYRLPLLSSPRDIVSRRSTTPILDYSLALPSIYLFAIVKTFLSLNKALQMDSHASSVASVTIAK